MTQAAKQTDDNEDATSRYYKAENRLFHAKTVENKANGEVVKMTNNLEKLYAYMLNQYKWYKSIERPFAESKERIGTMARIGDAKKMTKSYIDKLIALGLVSILVKSKQKGVCDVYKVFKVDEVAKNLVFTYPTFEGKPLYDHEKRLGNGNNRANQTAQQEAPQAQQEQHLLADADEPAPNEEFSPDVVTDKPITPTESNTVKSDPAEVEIFDYRDVVTEGFINALSGDAAPNRNADGTLQSFRYVYWVARHTQDARDGVTVRTREEYMAEAKPCHVPPHLLPKVPKHTSEPRYDQ